MNSLRTFIILLFFTISLISSAVLANSKQEYAPQQQLTQMLKAHRGKVIYLDFWASWCGPCRKSFPWMNTMKSTYNDQGFVVISINVDNDKTYAIEFLAENPANFPIIYDPKGKVARQYKLKGMPSSFIYNRAGELVSSHVGFNPEKMTVFENEIKLLLAKH